MGWDSLSNIPSDPGDVLNVRWRRVACVYEPPHENLRLVLKNGTHQWTIEAAATNVAHGGALQSMELRTPALVEAGLDFVEMTPIHGQFFKLSGEELVNSGKLQFSNLGRLGGPFEFRLTSILDGQTIMAVVGDDFPPENDVLDAPLGDFITLGPPGIDVGANF